MIGREDEVRGYRERARFFYAAVFLSMTLLVARLFFLQVLKGDELRKFSEANRLKKDRIFPTRGVIFDRDGKVIVDNRAAFDVVMLSQYYHFNEDTNTRLSHALQMPVEELERKLTRVRRLPSFYPVLLRADVSKDILAGIEMDSNAFPGIDIEATVQRRYPYGDIAAQLLGYIGEVDSKDIKNDPEGKLQPGDYIGKMGIERNYDPYLRGVNGVGYVEVDAMGRRRKRDEPGERLLGYVTSTEPVPGDNLYLTLDADLQQVAAQSMKSRGFHGSVVALDPRSGEVLALVNDPSYEPGLISGREVDPKVWVELSQSKDRPLRNRAIQDHYPPGSTFKPFLAIAALAEGIATTETTVNCAGSMQFGSRRFHCWKRHGVINFTRAIKESCDIFFYQMGIQLGIDRIAKYARLFGLGSQTGIRITGEQKGLIPDSEWKRKVFHDIWHPGETLSVAIGQGYVEVTPMQLAAAYAAIGNGGFVYRPYIVRRIERRDGELIKEFQPELTRKIELPQGVFDAVKEGLFEVINQPGGTAFLSRSKLTVLSGKTGTAQVRSFTDIMHKSCPQMEEQYRHHGWFVGYAPRENPQIAVAVIAEHACHGAAAAHVAQELVNAYFEKQARVNGLPLVEEPPPPATKVALVKKKPKAKPVEESDDDDEDSVLIDPEVHAPIPAEPPPAAARPSDDDETPGKPDRED